MPSIRLLAGLLAACTASFAQASAPESPAPQSTGPVILVSVDGLRAHDPTPERMPRLSAIGREGVRAEWMNPSYPSLTFPNHYTLVTGLRPDRHGITHNSMQDPELGTFRLGDAASVRVSGWWGGEPIWVGAERAGLRTATMFWPGSEAEIQGMRPSLWRAYDKEIASDARVDQVLAWLDAPEGERPRLATLYFDAVDTASHDYGPDSEQAARALAEVDQAIGRLRDGLAARGLLDRTHLIVVSDHGMAPVPPEHRIAVEDLVGKDEAKVVSVGQLVGMHPVPGREAEVEAKVLGRHEHATCWRKGELPERFRYGTHPHIPPILCQLDEGWDMLPRDYLGRIPARTRGSHGYDPALPSMRAVFIARGPAFRSGTTLPAFDNVDVYPLLARLLGIRPAANDGDIGPLLPALRDAE